MASGSNARISILTGDNGASMSVNTNGDWNNGVNNVNYGRLQYIYAHPGDFQIQANISNALNYFVFTQLIRIISRVDDLNVGLVDSPVIFESYYKNGVGRAQFRITTNATSQAGSHAFVTFWPGDSANATQGPFQLGMDYISLASQIAFSHEYTSTGTFVCTFLVENPLGSKVFTLNVQVVISIAGFYIDVNPKYAQPNQVVTIWAYMIQGNAVSLSFFQNGIQIGATRPRISTSHLIGDSQTFTPTLVQDYAISVTAADSFTTQSLSYVIRVQNPVSFTATLDSLTPVINNESKRLGFIFVDV